jgi:heterodisulfide reductase subunit A-like polyferredoxin
MEQTELIVIGAGPAGIQAAIIASELGLEVTLIAIQPSVGGQYFKTYEVLP